MTALSIPDEGTCPVCKKQPIRRTCSECGVSALLTNCIHMRALAGIEPTIGAGQFDGTDMDRDFCSECARTPTSDALAKSMGMGTYTREGN